MNTFRNAILLITFLLLFASPGFGKPKPATRTYNSPCVDVWKATRSAVKDHYDVLNLNDQDLSGSFTTGSAWSGVRPIAFSLSGTGNACTVSVTGHFSGLIHNDKGDFFSRIEAALKAQAAVAIDEKTRTEPVKDEQTPNKR